MAYAYVCRFPTPGVRLLISVVVFRVTGNICPWQQQQQQQQQRARIRPGRLEPLGAAEVAQQDLALARGPRHAVHRRHLCGHVFGR